MARLTGFWFGFRGEVTLQTQPPCLSHSSDGPWGIPLRRGSLRRVLPGTLGTWGGGGGGGAELWKSGKWGPEAFHPGDLGASVLSGSESCVSSSFLYFGLSRASGHEGRNSCAPCGVPTLGPPLPHPPCPWNGTWRRVGAQWIRVE